MSELSYEAAHRAYQQASNPVDITKKYSLANRWYQARTVFISTTALTWLYSLVDGLLRLRKDAALRHGLSQAGLRAAKKYDRTELARRLLDILRGLGPQARAARRS